MAPFLRTESGQLITSVGLLTGGMLFGVGGMGARSIADNTPDSTIHEIGTGLLVVGGSAALTGAALLTRGGVSKVSKTLAYDVVLGVQELKPFHIRRMDVDAFLRGSAIRHPFFHTSSESTRASIIRSGADVSRNSAGVYGRAFYASGRPDHSFGDVGVAVAINAERPFTTPGWANFDARVAELARSQGRHGPLDEVATRETLLEAGYDSILIKRGLRADWLAGLDSDKIRVVVAN